MARILDGLDPALLSGYECVELLQAQYRQLNHTKARLMSTMVEVGLRNGDGAERMAVPDEFSADEVRAALVWTRRAAAAQLDLAHDLVTRLPAVHAAMDAGVLDEPRARVFADWTFDLADDQARAVCAELLPRAAGWTTGQLTERVKRWAIAIDPDWARRRYEHAIAERRVVGYRNPDGSATLSGLNLPVDRVAAAGGRIDGLAKAAKQAGDCRPIDHIRADLFLGMTDGTYAPLDDADIIAQLLATSVNGPDGNAYEDGECRRSERDGGGSDGEEQTDPTQDPARANHAATSATGSADRSEIETGGEITGRGLELQVRLTTLLGYDEYPAELAGWGPVHAPLARRLARDMGNAQWRYAIADQHGQLAHAGVTRARPAGTGPRDAASRGTVELQVAETDLRRLAADPVLPDGRAAVIADLTRSLDRHLGPRSDEDRDDRDRRAPGAVLRRWLQARDRTCVMANCRHPARGTDQDHTVEHARGGSTVEANLGAVCRHDHRAKHQGGWHLAQPEPGVFIWTSRLGRRYHRRPAPVIEHLPAPLAGDRPVPAPPGERWCAPRIWPDPPPTPEPAPVRYPGLDVPPY